MNNNLTAEELWSKIISYDRPHMLCPFPRMDNQTGEPLASIAMVVLTAEESAIVVADAEKKCRKLLKDNMPAKTDMSRGYDELYNTLVSQGLLYEVCRNPNDIKKKFFPSKESILQTLTIDEMSILINHYYTVQLELGPIISNLTVDEMENWKNKIMQGGTSNASFLLASCSLEVLKTLVLYLANQLHSLQTSKSCSSSQQENTTTSE